MCTSRLNGKNTSGVDSGSTGQLSSTHPPSGQAVRSVIPTSLWTPEHKTQPPSTSSLTAKDSPMDLSNKKHEPVCHPQVSRNTWFGTATERHPVEELRTSEALDLTLPAPKLSFTELNIPCRKPVTKDESNPCDSKQVAQPGGSKEKQSRCNQKSAAFSGQNFTISGQNVVDKVLESLYYHMNTQNATAGDTKTCRVRSSGMAMKRKDEQKSAPASHPKVSVPAQCASIESKNVAAHKQFTRPPDGSSVRMKHDDIPTVSTTLKVSDIKPSMTFGEIQETLIRRAVEAPGSLLGGSVRRFSTGSASRAAAVARSTASACRRAASVSDTTITQNAPSKTYGNVDAVRKEGLGGELLHFDFYKLAFNGDVVDCRILPVHEKHLTATRFVFM